MKTPAELLAEALTRPYTVIIKPIEDDSADSTERLYYMAYLPFIGQSACSATGDTPLEALQRLEEVKSAVFQHFIDTGRVIPFEIPSLKCLHEDALPAFDEVAARDLPAEEVRRRWPRNTRCPSCGESGLFYASYSHAVAGDW